MNIILFNPAEVELPLACQDPRSQHLLQVLRRKVGDSFDCGLINGARGRGTIVAIGVATLTLSFIWLEPPPPLSPIHLLIGLPRPPTARNILREATSLGVTAMHFMRTERGEASYASSTLWQNEAWRECLLHGAAQAFCTRLPEISHGQSLVTALAALPGGCTRLALDNYESPSALATHPLPAAQPIALALGAERGWTTAERNLLRAADFTLVNLGARVLRTETACLAAITLIKARCGWL